MAKEIGVVEENHDLKQICWKIKDFFSLSSYMGDFYYSPHFSFAGETWYLSICRREEGEEDVSGWISLFLHKKRTSTKCSVQYTLDVQKADGSLLLNKEYVSNIFDDDDDDDDDNDDNDGYGCLNFLKSSDPVERKSELVPSGVLTVVCRIKKGSPLPAVTAASLKLNELDTLSKHFEDLLKIKKVCDVTLVVGKKSFQVHKSVLAARSPVFSAMFEHEMSESQTGTVDIPDCDEESFGTFLEYLYSGRLEGVSFGSALHLYRTAHKYDVQELKAFCLRILKECLTVEGVIDAVILADQYDEEDLMTLAQDFFNHNFDDIISTKQWESLNNRNFRLANKLTKGASSYFLTLKKHNTDLLKSISLELNEWKIKMKK